MSENEDFERLKRELSERDLGFNDDGESIMDDDERPSKTVLKMDYWSLRRGEELHDRVTEVDGDLGGKFAASDFLSLAFEPESEFHGSVEDTKRKEYIDTLMQTTEFRELHANTCLNELQSELAAVAFSRQYADLSKKATPSEVKKQAKKALDDAKEASDDITAMAEAMGPGGVGGDPVSENQGMDTKKALDMLTQAKYSRNIRAIINKAGRYRRFAMSAQSRKVIVGNDDVTGVKMGDDISKLIGSERMKLGCGITEVEDATMLRLSQRRCIIRENKATEPEAKGPVVICVDESGSMQGDNVQEAKSIALAMYWIAKQQRRWCCLYGFSGGTTGNYIVLKPGAEQYESVMSWLEHFFGNGTACDVPINVLPHQWQEMRCPAGKTDVVFLTDALVNTTKEIKQHWNDWRASAKAKVQTVIIGQCDGRGGDLDEVSDNLIHAKDFALGQAGKPVEGLFESI